MTCRVRNLPTRSELTAAIASAPVVARLLRNSRPVSAGWLFFAGGTSSGGRNKELYASSSAGFVSSLTEVRYSTG